MSWAIEAVEKAALQRATQQLLAQGPVTMLGMSVGQCEALRSIFHGYFGTDPAQHQPDEIVRMLRGALK